MQTLQMQKQPKVRESNTAYGHSGGKQDSCVYKPRQPLETERQNVTIPSVSGLINKK